MRGVRRRRVELGAAIAVVACARIATAGEAPVGRDEIAVDTDPAANTGAQLDAFAAAPRRIFPAGAATAITIGRGTIDGLP